VVGGGEIYRGKTGRPKEWGEKGIMRPRKPLRVKRKIIEGRSRGGTTPNGQRGKREWKRSCSPPHSKKTRATMGGRREKPKACMHSMEMQQKKAGIVKKTVWSPQKTPRGKTTSAREGNACENEKTQVPAQGKRETPLSPRNKRGEKRGLKCDQKKSTNVMEEGKEDLIMI